MKKVQKPVTQNMIREAYGLLMLGHTPMGIKRALNISDVEWGIINQSKLYHALMMTKELTQSTMESRIDGAKGVELSLFNCLARYKVETNPEFKAKLGTQIDELKQQYVIFNIYN